jgi:HPt (histidine-containing phosphotransfer) domain-containing protein
MPVVAGLDTRMGQQLVGGSLSLYLKLLQQFEVEHGPEAERVRAALGEDRPKDAERMAHSVKGAAAVLGADALSAASAALEIALRDNAPEMATRFELFTRELDAVCGPLRAHFER